MASTYKLSTLVVLLVLYHIVQRRKHKRTDKVEKIGERVLILGGTSGIGQSLVKQYAERGAKVCIVGRREVQLREVEKECRHVIGGDDYVFGVQADFTNVEDMIKVRGILDQKWQGLDTLLVVAGVSALQPLLSVGGVDLAESKGSLPLTTKEGIQKAADVSYAAIQGNYSGPLIAAVTFIPLLLNTSNSPSILLVSSLASVIPAPTRSIYASSKAAALVLFQCLAIEHPRIGFTHVMPYTVEGDFRASAVDGGRVRENVGTKRLLKREDVARRCITAVDGGERNVFVPGVMRYGHLLYWIWPGLIERLAKRKYKY